MSEKKFTCVLGKDYHIINNNVDNMSYYLQDGNDVVLVINLINRLVEENEQLKQEIKQYWKCRDKWKQEAKELKKEADYFERKKCEYWNMYNEAHSDRIILKKENEQLRHELDSLTGCYCADNKEFKDYWRIGYDD